MNSKQNINKNYFAERVFHLFYTVQVFCIEKTWKSWNFLVVTRLVDNKIIHFCYVNKITYAFIFFEGMNPIPDKYSKNKNCKNAAQNL